MAIDIVGLSRPEKEYREEVGTADEGDDQGQIEDVRSLLESRRKHWILGSFPLPDKEGNYEEEADEEGCENMGGSPIVLESVSQGCQLGREGCILDSLPIEVQP